MNKQRKNILEARSLPKGELWIGKEIFEEHGRKDDIEAHLELCEELGMTLASLPLGDIPIASLNHRLFPLTDIDKAAKSDLAVFITLSGPFQRLVDKSGLATVLAEVGRDSAELREALNSEAKHLSSLIEEALKSGAGAVVIAEDVAYDKTTFFSPLTFRELLCPLHLHLIAEIHQLGGQAYFHSDGNLTSVIDDIVSVGFEGLSCQEESMDLLAVKEKHGTSLTLLTGLGYGVLDTEVLSKARKEQYTQRIKLLAQGGGLILSSSSGLSSAREVTRVRELYGLAERAL